MKRKMPNIVMVCNKCGKPCEIDEEKSTKNWNRYKPCKCGGMAVPREVKDGKVVL